jgi:hypothetical protein
MVPILGSMFVTVAIAALLSVANERPAETLGAFAGSWRLERATPRELPGFEAATRLTIDVAGDLVTVTLTTIGGRRGLHSVLERYAVDGRERQAGRGELPATRICRALAGGGFDVIERSAPSVKPMRLVTDRWSVQDGRLVIVRRIEQNGRAREQRRVYRRR